MFVRSLEPAAPLAAAARAGARRSDLRLPPRDRLGAAAGRRRDRLRALDRLEGAQAGRDLAAAASGQGAGQPLRVALPRRSAAHGHQPLRALPAARPPRHRRPLPALRGRSAETRVGYDYAHAIVDDHSRLAFVELHDDEKAATVTGFVERALAFFAEHGIIAQAADDRQRLRLREATARYASCSPATASATSPPSRTGRAPTAKSNASTKRWRANGPTASPTAHTDNATQRCHTGSTTTTGDDHTAHSATGPRSAAFTTSVGRTTRRPASRARRPTPRAGRRTSRPSSRRRARRRRSAASG